MNFGQALEILKGGGKVARAGWNGRNMHLYLSPWKLQDVLGYEPCIVMHTAQGLEQPGWLASQPDMLAEDWMEVP